MNILRYRDLFKNKILHRDIKPANILKTKETFKIADFGFAKRIDHLDDLMTSIAGTPLYMSP
jgi:serine/threonine protein kinase